MRGDAGFPVRFRFAKHGPVRFLGHRDVARCFERALRVEQLPLAFTAGFSPHPKVGFGLALSVGHESDAEYLDVELTHDPGAVDGAAQGIERFPAALSAALPEGIDVVAVAPLADRAPSLQEAVTAVEYRVEIAGADPADRGAGDRVAAAVGAALGADALTVTRTRKGREVEEDIRPAIRTIDVLEVAADHAALHLELATKPRNARPGDVVAALNAVAGVRGAPLAERRVRRTHQWIERPGARLEPLDADRRQPVLEARAS